jgi:hypothetical protein
MNIYSDLLSYELMEGLCHQNEENSIFLPSLFPQLPAKLTSRFLLPVSSRQIDESISIAGFFPPN